MSTDQQIRDLGRHWTDAEQRADITFLDASPPTISVSSARWVSC